MSSDPETARLIERQMRNWELARTQAEGSPRPPDRVVEDFVCISYAWGSGGDEIAQGVARRLGWPIFDRHLLQEMACGDDIRQRLYESMDERDLHWFEEYVRAFFERDFDRNDYFHRLTTTIVALARKGRAVFLGRGCDLMLPRELGFRVRIVAPRAYCVARYARVHGCDERAAAERVDLVERERREFVLHHFGARADDPARFDLILNAESFPLDAAANLILSARTLRGRS
ncbi:MAG: hypothetical protein BroJett003_20350 [Planctomycetota bacterium]|nr:MAG: hypothetical protein BroJett003_20350 [Planctomycetota bacterium]